MSADVMLVTGASSGIGRACAEHFHRLGWKVYGASRGIQALESPAFAKLTMDVDDDASVKTGIEQIADREGRLDAVVHCAGFGLAGAVEDTATAEAQAQLDTNFYGAVRVCRSALPIMRGQRSGILIMMSSLGGLTALPFQALYSASKFALEGLTEALRMEVRPFGVRVVLVEPGNFGTGITANRQFTAASGDNPAYRERFEAVIAKQAHDEIHGADPVLIARLVERIVKKPKPKLRYTIGPLEERIGASLKQILPYRIYEALLMRYHGL